MAVKKIKCEFTEAELEIVLQALGNEEHNRFQKGHRSRPVRALIDKIYRAMGVRLPKV